MFARMFRDSPLPKSLPEGTSLIDRLNSRLSFYLKHDKGFLSHAGERRALAYQATLSTYADLGRVEGKPADYQQVMRVFRDVTQEYGVKPLETSMKLRMHLMEALSEHLGMSVSAFTYAIDEMVYQLAYSGAPLSNDFISNAKITAARDFLSTGLYARNYKSHEDKPYQLQPNEMEMTTFKKKQ